MTNNIPSSPEASRPPVYGELLAASTGDLGDIRALMQEASDFKQSQGDDLWGDAPFTDEEVAKLIDSGNMFVYKLAGVTAASLLLTKNDERMWGEDEGGDGSALYIHRLCVGDAFRSQGIGSEVVQLAEEYALKDGRTKLRLDCPYDNQPLCKYYERLGFSEVRRYDRPSSVGARNPNKDVYRAAFYQKDLSEKI